MRFSFLCGEQELVNVRCVWLFLETGVQVVGVVDLWFLRKVRPTTVVQTILEILLGLQQALGAYFAAVSFSTVAFFTLAISLSLRLRASELELMRRIGGSKRVIF